MAELANLRPIFKGEEAKVDSKKNIPFQRDQLLKIFEVLGTPNGSSSISFVYSLPSCHFQKEIGLDLSTCPSITT